ncbi:MAG: hypothetical protein ACP5TO_08410, partial [Thermoplasmata archaeon]
MKELANEFGISTAFVNTYKASVMEMLAKEKMPATLWNYIAETLRALGADENAMKHAGNLPQKFLKGNGKIWRKSLKVVAGAIAYRAMH